MVGAVFIPSHHTGGLTYYSSATHGWYLQSWGSSPNHVPPAPELGTHRPTSDSLPFVSSKQFQPHEALMNTHDRAKHTHAGPLGATNTHETHTMGSSGKFFPMESPDSLECESQSSPSQKSSLPGLTKPPADSLIPALPWPALGLSRPGTPGALPLAWKLCAGGV